MPNLKSIRERTFDRVTKIINEELSGRTLWEVPGPNDSYLRGYSLHGAVVIVHFYKDGGCHHYVAGHGGTWNAMETQLHQIAAEQRAYQMHCYCWRNGGKLCAVCLKRKGQA